MITWKQIRHNVKVGLPVFATPESIRSAPAPVADASAPMFYRGFTDPRTAKKIAAQRYTGPSLVGEMRNIARAFGMASVREIDAR